MYLLCCPHHLIFKMRRLFLQPEDECQHVGTIEGIFPVVVKVESRRGLSENDAPFCIDDGTLVFTECNRKGVKYLPKFQGAPYCSSRGQGGGGYVFFSPRVRGRKGALSTSAPLQQPDSHDSSFSPTHVSLCHVRSPLSASILYLKFLFGPFLSQIRGARSQTIPHSPCWRLGRLINISSQHAFGQYTR